MAFSKAAPAINLGKYMKTWFVVAGRTTALEKGHFDATEAYTWNDAEERIDVVYRARKGGFDGKKVELKQKAWLDDFHTRSRWKVRAHYLPIHFGYLVLAVATDYSWAAVGVPNEKYLWILSETPTLDEISLATALSEAKSLGYPVHDVERKPQSMDRKLTKRNDPAPRHDFLSRASVLTNDRDIAE